jgi:L-alanine-DL-glutamate epimerase-like enolase superfamily enzyme
VEAVRGARPDVGLYVDANAAWTPEEAVHKVRYLEAYGLDMVEQPVAKDDIEGMGFVQSKVDVPIVADESLQSLMDVDRLAAVGVRGLNLKLMKFGGLGPGLQILQRGRKLGMQIMLGCMVETSLGVTAMAHLMGLADWIDLDSPLLISNDPFEGVRYEGAYIHLPERPGIGVVLRDDVPGR